MPRRSESGLSLVEILIALFIFLVGILGVLSIFPVAMSSAGKAIGEVRGNILAQSALAQVTADCRTAYEEGAVTAAGAASQLIRATPADTRVGYFATLTSGSGKGQCRLITDDAGGTLTVTPDWSPVPPTWTSPVVGDRYVITRLGLPSPRSTESASRSGYVRELRAVGTGAANTICAGLADFTNPSDPGVVPMQWNISWHNNAVPAEQLFNDPPDAGATYAIIGSTAPDEVQVAGNPFTGAERGSLVLLLGPDTWEPCGQVRLISAVPAGNTLKVFPNWASQPSAPVAGAKLVIRARVGYYLLITSGKAAGRILRITGYTSDAAIGDQITCAGADFDDMGVTAARREAAGADYKLKNATSFVILGSDSFLTTVHPYWAADPAATPSDRLLPYRLNAFGLRTIAEPQTATDIHFRDNTEQASSDYSAVCIFSDNGPVLAGAAATRPAVRVDVLVFLNFDTAKELQANRRAVAHMSGYIRRP